MRLIATILFGLAVISGTCCVAEEDFHSILKRSVEDAEARLSALERELALNGTGHSRRSTRSSPRSLEMERAYALHELTVEALKGRHNISHEELHRHVRQATNSGCPVPSANCDSRAKYRNFDGTCNNLGRPSWGATTTAQTRLFQQTNYCNNGDGIRGCGSLPNSRFISFNLHRNVQAEFTGLTNMVHQFGQFLDHDLSLTPEAGRQCCSNPNQLNCLSIQDDTREVGRTCIDFTRSTPCFLNNRREQTNMNTAFIDASQIYGSSKTRSDQLRAFQGGRLLSSSDQNTQGFLPFKNQNQGLASNNVQGDFIAGDDRINEMPALAALHNLFLREHNRIADELASLTRSMPNWNDERIFQETRRIMGAMLQVITYNEYLPTVLGPSIMSSQKYNLNLLSSCTNYDPNLDPSIMNEFSTAAYRFGHTLVSEFLPMHDPGTKSEVDSIAISESYFQSAKVTKNQGRGFNEILAGLTITNSRMFDRFVVPGLTRNLFKAQNANFGGDLIARNIQRGRDHGLLSYNAYRTRLGGSSLTNGRPSDMTQDAYNALMNVYGGNVENIDLFSGALNENPFDGGASGYTFQHIKAEQFRRLKFGDRFFLTHCTSGFTQDQVNVLLRRRLSHIMCQSSQHPSVRQNVFRSNIQTTIPCFTDSSARVYHQDVTMNLRPFITA